MSRKKAPKAVPMPLDMVLETLGQYREALREWFERSHAESMISQCSDMQTRSRFAGRADGYAAAIALLDRMGLDIPEVRETREPER